MAEVLAFLISKGYSAQLKGKSWASGLKFMEGMESTGRHFQLGYEVVFTAEMVKEVTVKNENFVVVIELVN